MIIAWASNSWEEFLYWQSYDKKVYKKILRLIKDIERNRTTGIGKPERLAGDLAGYWSRRIDSKNRLVYKISEDTITIAQCGSHYREK